MKDYTRARPTFSDTVKYWKSLPDEFSELIKGPGLDPQGEWVLKNTFPDYWTNELFTYIELWSRYKKYGLPLSIGWAEHPAWIIDVLDTIDTVVQNRREEINADDRRANNRGKN